MYNEFLKCLNLAANATLLAVLTVIMFTIITFFFHRKKRRLDYLLILLAAAPIYILTAYNFVMIIIEHVNYIYPPEGITTYAGRMLLFADMIVMPILAVFSTAILKAGRLMAIEWAKTADKAKAFSAFGLSLSVSFGKVQVALEKEAEKVRSLDFLSIEEVEDGND